MTRLLALTLLLRSMTDLDYNPPTWSNSLRRQSIAGEGPSSVVSCGACQGEGIIRKRGMPQACPNPYCKDGQVTVDAYTLRMVSTGERLVHRVKALRCDSCAGNGAFGNGHRCERCGGSGWVEVSLERLRAVRAPLDLDGPDLGPGDPVLRAMEGRQAQGDYDDLGLALAALRLDHRGWYRLVVGVYVLARSEDDELPVDEILTLDQGMRYLLELMPAEIRVPSWAGRNERRRREQLKRKAAA